MKSGRCLLAAALALLFSASVPAAITLDGTLGTSGSLTGPNYAITENLGQTRGNNLFHSFGQFSLANGEIATFSGSANINNVIARVTGGNVSSIDGTISSTISGANLYLINPSGIVFGANARLDVSGSFYTTTADYLGLADGGRFDARTPANSVLTAAAPSAFGFLGSQPPAPITVQAAGLYVSTGKTLALIGGDLSIDGPGSFGVRSTLIAGSGRINLVSVASAGEVIEEANGIDVSSFSSLGRIRTGNAAFIGTAGYPGGRIFIRAGELTLDYTAMSTSTYGAVSHPGTGYDIAVTGTLSMRHAEMASTSFAAGNAGSIHIQAGALEMTGSFTSPDNPIGIQASIGSRARGTGRGGDVEITTGRLLLDGDAAILNNSLGAGQAGDIRIQASDVQLNGTQGDAFISSSAFNTGHAGNITIDAGRVSVVGGRINPYAFTGIATQVRSSVATAANGGTIQINSGTLEVLNGGQISSIISTGSGRGGDININASSVRVSGVKGNGIASAIVSGTTGSATTGNGGNLNLAAGSVQVEDGGNISSSTVGSGNAGHIAVNATERIGLRHGVIAASASGGGNGNGGDITLSAPSVDLANGSFVTASSGSTGRSGDIRIEADRLTLGGKSAITTSALLSDGGNITVLARSLVYLNNSTITTSVQGGAGNGGNIFIDPDFVILNHSAIEADAFGGNGGNVDIIAGNFLMSPDSSVTASSAFGLQGSISINSPTQDLSGELEKLPESAVDAAARFKNSCAASAGRFSRFVVPGAGAFSSNGLAYSTYSDRASGAPAAEIAGLSAGGCHL